MKKDLVFVLGATQNISFALANVIIGLQRHNGHLYFDIIVFEQGITEKDKSIITSIHPTQFIEYKAPSSLKSKNLESLNRFTALSLSIYECFSLLKDYKKVIWLDCDILVQKKLDKLIEQTNDQMWMFLETNKTKDNQIIQCYNSGIVVFNESIEDYAQLTKWCYDKTFEMLDSLENPDQAILNLIIQAFGIKITTKLDGLFNCHPISKNSHKAEIVHTAYTEKFWNFYYYKQWEENYKKWLNLGGSPCINKKNKPFEGFLRINSPLLYDFIKKPRKTFKSIFLAKEC